MELRRKIAEMIYPCNNWYVEVFSKQPKLRTLLANELNWVEKQRKKHLLSYKVYYWL